jgi:hypothetical protein
MSSGYACPVCGVPQRDGEHLANHLAFTAMLRGEEHEDWLDEHVSDWSAGSPDELAERVVDFAEATEYEDVFEDTVAQSSKDGRGSPDGTVHDHDGHDHAERGRPDVSADAAPRSRGEAGAGIQSDLSDDAAAVLDEARRMTEEMYEDAADPVVERDGEVGDDAESADSDPNDDTSETPDAPDARDEGEES